MSYTQTTIMTEKLEKLEKYKICLHKLEPSKKLTIEVRKEFIALLNSLKDDICKNKIDLDTFNDLNKVLLSVGTNIAIKKIIYTNAKKFMELMDKSLKEKNINIKKPIVLDKDKLIQVAAKIYIKEEKELEEKEIVIEDDEEIIIDINKDMNEIANKLDMQIKEYNKYTQQNPMLGISYDSCKNAYILRYKNNKYANKILIELSNKMIELLIQENNNDNIKLYKNYNNYIISYKVDEIELFDILHIINLLKLKDAHSYVIYTRLKDKIIYSKLYKNKYNGYVLKEFITLDVIKDILYNSNSPHIRNICTILKINIKNDIILTKESKYMNYIITAFNGEEIIKQHSVDNYRIDLYFPKYKLAIECDENGHADRNVIYEVKRETYIKDKLKCTFIRYNPDEINFDIFKIINMIYIKIK